MKITKSFSTASPAVCKTRRRKHCSASRVAPAFHGRGQGRESGDPSAAAGE